MTRPFPWATTAVLAVTAVPSLAQIAVPALTGALERHPDLIRAGEWWRLVTSLVVQDGGLAGTAFNLATLLVVGVLAERALGPGRWLALYLVGAAAGQTAGLVFGTVGAGNSIAVCGLAGGLAAALLGRAGDLRSPGAAPSGTASAQAASQAAHSGTAPPPSRAALSPLKAFAREAGPRPAAAVAAWYALIMIATAAEGAAAIVVGAVTATAGAQLVLRRDRLPRWAPALAVLAAGAVLSALANLHGPALLGGLAAGAVLALTAPALPRATRTA
ncbi:rhomboid family intramembrane serine protease [Microbispora sp. ATCC PTA-5024]|uniref:rhomboid family intramembrane serine protease n=1 Tax=Microbispora sp. ATCC PTA-5024 TaxID=316330 RepID=UPI0003DC8D29|nr:rhomboid family intramembrane serine protease [Microbispora sp. ATCC PTA-5024]ETK31820.1 membrane protein [Microbispora sp. ATCC PTA-5024]